MIILESFDSDINWFQYLNALVQICNKVVITDGVHELLTTLLLFLCPDDEISGRDNSVEDRFTLPQASFGIDEASPTRGGRLYQLTFAFSKLQFDQFCLFLLMVGEDDTTSLQS
ncbi:hypothetical protein BASA62_002268 [Batrachochytrium salamandrivorans]|nr:hypothetical protein BASA62_002268 [Batrachochytrium salamandrivorans]